MPYITVEDKVNYILKRVELSEFLFEGTPCWLWTKGLNLGYGRFTIQGKNFLAHRELYQLVIRVLKEDEVLDHLCRNRSCCNPRHLDVTNLVDNCRRGNSYGHGGERQKAKTHCPQGHQYTEENTLRKPNGGRSCRKCTRAAQKAYKLKIRETL